MTGWEFWPAWFGTSFALAAPLTGRIIAWAERLGVVDRPNARSSHTRVTPRGGGAAIVAVTVLASCVAGLLDAPAGFRLAAAVVPAVAVATVSWIDDVRSLRNRVRFGVHLLAAAAATALLGPIRELELGHWGRLDLGPLSWPLTILWITGLTNAFNFMDGIDGIAGLTATAAGLGLAVAARSCGCPSLAAACLAFAGAAVGFLTRNWPPARIFMGDVGSAFCGFLLAVLPMAAAPPGAVALTVPVAVLALWPFIFDTIFTLLRRLRRGENIFQAHRSHLYQRLVIAGWSHAATSTLYGWLATVGAAVAVAPLVNPAVRQLFAPIAVFYTVASGTFLVFLVMLAERWRPSTRDS